MSRNRKGRLIDYALCVVAILLTVGVLFGTMRAHAQTVQYYDSHGRNAGTATTYGDTVTFHDRQGRDAGTATTNSSGTTTFRDRQGRTSGTATQSTPYPFPRNR